MLGKFKYRFLFLLLLPLFWGTQTYAQDQKIGYVDTDYILSQMSEYEGIKKQLSSISSAWNEKLTQMEQEIENLQKEFDSKEILYTDELRAEKKQKIQNLIQQRQRFLEQKFGSEGEYFTKQKELLEPLQRKVFNAINQVANRQGFDFIFDRAENSGMLFGVKEWNLNDEVLKELDVTLNESSN